MSDDGLSDTRLAGFILHAKIGEGGMGVVWSATQEALQRPAAVKIVRAELAGDPAFCDRFLAEARVAASLEHPNVVPVYDAGEDGGVLYLGMALVEGVDLRQVISEEGKLEPASAVAVLDQAAKGLEAVHSAGLVHRDVKPANILIRAVDGRVMVTDFGLARSVDGPNLTRTGMIVGTLDYIAPEQIEGVDLDARSDIYSLGAVLYEALTGQPPYPRGNAAAQMNAHLNEPPPRPSDQSPELAPFDPVIAKAMAKNPDERFANASSLAAAAREVTDGETALSPRFRSTVASLSVVKKREPAGAAAAVVGRSPAQTRADSRDATTAESEGKQRADWGRPALVGGLLAIMGLAVAGLVLAATRDGGTTRSVVRETVVMTGAEDAISTDTSPSTADTRPAPPATDTFHAPSGNVSCRIEGEAARCSVAVTGETFTLPSSGRAFIEDGSVLGRSSGRPLNWGETVSLGAITCRIPREDEASGVTCRNSRTGHGFEASRRPERKQAY